MSWLKVSLCALALVCYAYGFQKNMAKASPFRLVTSRFLFSGIVEEIGEVESLVPTKEMTLWDGSVSEGVELTVRANTVTTDAYIGCSIAVNGVCLTAVTYDDKKFTVGLAPETLRRSNLGKLAVGSRVNLERALKSDSRNSGHVVQGHVDSTGEILKKWQENDTLWMRIKVPQNLINYIVPKGCISVDGTSLTVCEVDKTDSCFTYMLLPHTQQNVILPSKEEGDLVNIEVDYLAKMVEQSMSGVLESIKGGASGNAGPVADTVAVPKSEWEDMKARLTALESVVKDITK